MKWLLSFILLFMGTTGGFAQGKVQFNNDSVHLVYFTTDSNSLLPADVGLAGLATPATNQALLTAELWAGTSSSTLQYVTNTTFGAIPGRWTVRNVTLPFAGGSSDYYQIQVYTTTAASYAAATAGVGLYYGETPIFTAVAGAGAAYNSLVNPTSPALSTWPAGGYPIPGSSYKGAIMLQAGLQAPSPPVILTQPADQTVIEGQTVTFTVVASGVPPPSYHWFRGSGDVAGATNATYAISRVQASDAGSYSVVVSNPYGSATSGVATLTVVFPPSITRQPSGTTVPAGVPITLTVAASGTEPLCYQWLNGTGAISGATNASLTMSPVQTNNADGYFVVVTNLYGAATSSIATVTVYVPVRITVQPASRTVPARSTASFTVLADGFPPPGYQWSFWGTNLLGATSSSLTITNVRLADLGDYAVFVNNGNSSRQSASATLTMSPSITSPYLGATAIWGRSAGLTVSAIGSGRLSYQWYKDGVLIASGTNQVFNLPTVQLGDGGYYSVVVSSDYGSVTNSAQLVLNPAGTGLGLYAGITISGAAGYTYEIQYSTDLRVTNSWVSLTNRILEQPVELWVDITTNAAETQKRFYRILPGQ